MVDTEKGAGPFTVFAPRDDAFAKLPAGIVETLVKPENKAKFAAIPTLDVMSGKAMAADVVGQKLTPATVNGETLDVDGTNGVTVNGASVTTADIACTNGVIHVADTAGTAAADPIVLKNSRAGIRSPILENSNSPAILITIDCCVFCRLGPLVVQCEISSGVFQHDRPDYCRS